MHTNNVSDIPELKKAYVHIKDKQGLQEKIRKIIKDGPGKLQIVADFDLTLTRFQGGQGLTTWDIFWACPSIPPRIKIESDNLKAKYQHIETDATLNLEDKVQSMNQWYMEANALLKGLTFPKTDMIAVAEEMAKKAFRPGVKEMICWAQEFGVPVLVFSAGQGDSIRYVMEAGEFNLPNVEVVSNFLEIGADGKITGLKGTIIHTLNKNEIAIKDTPYYETIKSRKNVIVVGDNDGDAGMADGMDSHVVIKIGINGRGNIDKNLPVYLSKFDIVLNGDPTFEVINALLKLLQ